MHPWLENQKQLWRAVATALVLYALDDIVTRHLWLPIEQTCVSLFPAGYLEHETIQAYEASAATGNHEFYLIDMPRGLLENLVIQVLAYHSQVLLDRIFPPRPMPRAIASKPGDDDKEIRGREELETEIMQKLIAEGRMKPVGIKWRNVILKWVLDDTIGTLLFAAIAFLLHCATRLHGPTQIIEEFPDAMMNSCLAYLFSASPFFSLIGHAYVPAQLRGQFWAAADLTLNLTMSVLLRPLVPWFMELDFVQQFLEQSVEQARMDQWWKGEMARLDAKPEQAARELDEMIAGWSAEREEL